MNVPGYLRAQGDGVVLCVKLQPRASTNAIGEAIGNELRIKVNAAPVDAAANEALLLLLAERLGCHRNKIQIIRGHTSRHKVLKLYGMSLREVVAGLTKSA